MGYTRIVQYADVTEVYEYDKKVYRSKKLKYRSALRKKRDKENKTPKTARSMNRAKQNFFRLVHHNMITNEELPVLITLTSFTNISVNTGYDAIKLFFRKLIKYQNDTFPKSTSNIKYIAVPELQPTSKHLHYHLIVWGLQNTIWRHERSNRLLQRFWQRGYIDVRSTTNKSEKIAGYLAKYFLKAQKDTFFAGRRSYTSSRNINKTSTYGSNQLSDFLQHIVDPVNCVKSGGYSTMWLGKCKLSIYKNKFN